MAESNSSDYITLVVDDDTEMASRCAKSLERLGAHAVVCNSGRRAVEEAERHAHRIRIMLIDVNLAAAPLSSNQHGAHLQSDDAPLLSLLIRLCPDVVVVQTSTEYFEELAERGYHGYQIHPERFLKKPFSPSAFLAVFDNDPPRV
jgi:CheY-like chemotaxis protein